MANLRPQMVRYRLHTLDGLIRTINGRIKELSATNETIADGLFCPKCGDNRRMQIRPHGSAVHLIETFAGSEPNPYVPSERAEEERREQLSKALTPSVFLYRCVQCGSLFTALVYSGPDGAALAVLPQVRGGLRTTHTPEGVAYYLDQAQKAMAVGANSAAVAMYRGALEHLLFEQHFQNGMLSNKINALEQAVGNGTAPKWAADLDSEFLRVLSRLGNGAIHPNDGDISKQAQLDTDFLSIVAETFMHLLLLVYEVPHEKNSRLSRLQAMAQALKK